MSASHRSSGSFFQYVFVWLSYCFHQLLSFLLKGLMPLAHRASVKRVERMAWRTLSDTATRPGFLPSISVLGPRWNCHALIAGMGPISVRSQLTCHVAELQTHADSWSLVVYDSGGRTAAWTGSSRTEAEEVTLHLPPDDYTLTLRYYAGA